MHKTKPKYQNTPLKISLFKACGEDITSTAYSSINQAVSLVFTSSFSLDHAFLNAAGLILL